MANGGGQRPIVVDNTGSGPETEVGKKSLSFDTMLIIRKIGIEINLACVENTHRGCIYNKEHMS